VSNRRQDRRWPRRVQVRFWRRDQPEQVFYGFTSDVSEGGAFIVTATPIGTSSRIRVEILAAEGGFVAEAVVRRSQRVHRDLQSIKTSGMGVRFLGIAELVHELLPHAEAMEERNEASPPHDPHPEETISLDEVAAAANAAAANERTSAPTSPSDAAKSLRTDGVGAAVRELSVRFRGLEDLRQIYDRDLQHGGLFVATGSPAEVGTRVRLHLYLPGEGAEPLLTLAKVVHVFEPSAITGSGRNLLSGMGVLFEDPEAVLARVRPLIATAAPPRSGV
jgi:Tfp pilus assembly protein PilZ